MTNKKAPIKKYINSTILQLFIVIIQALLIVGIMLYFINYIKSIADKTSYPSPLDLAILSATLGGFILIGAFYDKSKENIKTFLRRTGVYFLIASLTFCIEFFFLLVVGSITDNPLTLIDWVIISFTLIMMIPSSLSFTLGLTELVNIIIALIQRQTDTL
ncbi:MAG: hypothetical protein ABSC51_12370 [Gaiellaceae bacterium]